MGQITREDMRYYPVNKVEGSVTRYVHLVYATQILNLECAIKKRNRR